MQINRSSLLLLVLLFSVNVFGQPDQDAQKERQARLNAILEESLADVQGLKLPENRAFFYCRIGNLIWPQDQKRGRSLFMNAAAELANAQTWAESKRSINPYNELLTGGNTRQQILNLIASRDAELALDLLVRTRPAAIARAIASGSDKSTRINHAQQNDLHLAQNETYMEQNFYRLAAEQSPERAVKLLKESLSKGFSHETFQQLSRLAEKDTSAAGEMAAEVVAKLLRASYMSDEQPLYINIQLSQSILSHHISRQNGDGTKLKFSEAQMRDLAAKFISAYVSDQRTAPYIGPSVLQVAEKLQPSSVEQIKKLINRMNGQNGTQPDLDAAYQKLMAPDTPIEQLLNNAEKFPTGFRRNIYQTASNKLMGEGNWQAAREVLDENFGGVDREQMLANFDQSLAYNLIGQSKFTEAEQVIDRLPDQQRMSLLIYLSSNVYSRDPKENKAYATALLGKARQITNETPENSNEMGLLMQLIGGYSNIDAAEAIRLYEGVVPKIIELTDASAVINGFQVNSNVREGEFVMTQGDPFHQYGGNLSMIGAFSRFDIDRTTKLIDSFNRQDMRLSLRVQLLEGSEIANAGSVNVARSSYPMSKGRR